MICVTAPSKTFIIGEYLALHGGPCLVATHSPYFNLKTEPAAGLELVNIHPDSPAGRFVSDHQQNFATQKLVFNDPHQGAGGFGASTAQFLLCYQLCNTNYVIDQNNYHELLTSYQNYAGSKRGPKPSGADVLAQAAHNKEIIYFNNNRNIFADYFWPFADINYLFLRTKQKLATHTHLAYLDDLNTHSLRPIAAAAVKALKSADSHQFIEAINGYAEQLKQQGLTAAHTQRLLNHYRAMPEVLAAKGCGAMGADVIMLIVKAPKC